ncbi:MAG: DUF3090 family protein [Actinomycetota bacterium]|nr:DUF3090 family protein [Actinomycetota bacterium]
MSRSFELPEADWATVGAVGEPGQRTFYMQARQESQLLTLKLEKQQVAALAQFLAEILADLPAPEAAAARGSGDLVEPVLAEWPVGSLQLAYDSSADRIVILAEEISMDDDDDDDDDDDGGEGGDPAGPEPGPPARTGGSDPDRGAARIGITRESAAVIVRVGAELVTAGRPACTLCGRPIDPEGHMCPRTNGHRPH